MGANDNIVLEKVTEGLRYVSSGFHAVPNDNPNPLKTLPAMHRFFNVMGMAGGFAAAKYLADIAYGHKINGSQYEIIDRKEVPPPLRWLHGVIDCNPFSDAPKDQWLKVLHQMIPAAGGAAGAIQGSAYFFKQNGTEAGIKSLTDRMTNGESLTPLESNTLATYKQGEFWRNAAGASAWLSSASGLTGLLYGTTLNTSFLLANNSKTLAGAAEAFKLPFLRNFSNTQSTMGLGPAKALDSIFKQTEKLCRAKPEAFEAAAEDFGKKIAGSVFAPMFRNLSDDEKSKIVTEIKTVFEQSFDKEKDPKIVQSEITGAINHLLKTHDLAGIGGGMLAGNNGWLGKVAEFMDFGKKIEAVREGLGGAKGLQQEVNHHALQTAAALGGAGVLGLAALQGASAHAAPEGKSALTNIKADEYVKSVTAQQGQKKPRGFINGTLLDTAKWFGDAALAVVPVHRVWCSIGLTAGGGFGLWAGKLLTGRNLASGVEAAKESFPEAVRGLHGLLSHDPLSATPNDRLKALAGKFVFAASCAIGVMAGSKYAYAPTEKKNNSKRDSIADYLALARQEHGNQMVPLVAGSSIFGSTAGSYLIPFVPGVNYGASLAYRTVSLQDRNVTAPGLQFLTDNKTNSYFGVREGLDYLAKYATYNPEKKPEQMESIALTVLSQIADASGIALNGQHIKEFLDKVYAVREQYWQEGGVPAEKQSEMLLQMKEHFSSKGLDKTLYESGLDTLQNVDFKKVGGAIGWVSRLMGSDKKIEALQKEYKETVTRQREEWLNVPEKTGAAYAWAEEPHKMFAQQIEKKPAITSQTLKQPDKPQESFQESMMSRAASAPQLAVGG